jgi:hypothetical protein
MIVSRLPCILRAVLIFALIYFLGVLIVGYRNFESVSFSVAYIIALAFGVGAFIYCAYKPVNEEEVAKQILEPVLPPGETLCGFTYGFTGPLHAGRLILGIGGDTIFFRNRRRKWYYLGASDQSLIVVQVKRNVPIGIQQVLRRSQVTQLKFEKIPIAGPRLTIQAEAEPMILWIEGIYMAWRAQELVKVWESRT